MVFAKKMSKGFGWGWVAMCLLLTVIVLSLGFERAQAQAYLPAQSITRDQLPVAKSMAPSIIVPKLETPLSDLYLQRNQLSFLSTQLSSQLGEYLTNGDVRVVILSEEMKYVAAIREAVAAAGGTLVAEFETRMEVVVPIAELKNLSELPGVLYIRRPRPVYPLDSVLNGKASAAGTLASTGTYVTKGVNASGANMWHAKNITGGGIKVAILDYFKDYTTAQSKGELPAKITKYGTVNTADSRHGTAVAEIIYDMAPGVDMTIASPGTATQMANYITGLAQAGNKVISSSIAFYLDEPGDGTGSVSSAINTATDTYGALYCQAAGNQAQYHWDGNFYDYDGDGIHDWAPGANVNQLGLLPSGTTISLFLRWNDWPVSNQDYDLYLLYWDGVQWQVAAASAGYQTGSQPPTESISVMTGINNTYWGFLIDGSNATSTKVLDIMGHNAPAFLYNKANRSLIDPATASRSFSVAAVDASSYARESYSSIGPTHGPGGSLSGGRAKPRIAGFSNVDTWAYGPGVFNGTSAATPHVAGAAALVRYAFPAYTPLQVMQFLEGRAVDQGAGGYDYSYGAGRLNLGAAPDVQRGLPFLLLLQN